MRGFDTYNFTHYDTIPTQEEAELQFRIQALSKEHGKKYRLLYDKLSNCSSEQRCSSSACPVCVLEDRKEYIRSAQSLFNDTDELDFITYIPYPLFSTTQKLKDIDIAHIKDKFRCYLKNSNITNFAIGCIEIDFDIESGVWMPHIHCISIRITPEQELLLRKSINRKHLKTRLGIKNRPLNIKPINDLDKVLRYTYKFMWQAKPSNEDRRVKRRKVRLPHDLFVEHLIVLDELDIRKLEFRYRLRRNKNGLSIFPQNSKSHKSP